MAFFRRCKSRLANRSLCLSFFMAISKSKKKGGPGSCDVVVPLGCRRSVGAVCMHIACLQARDCVFSPQRQLSSAPSQTFLRPSGTREHSRHHPQNYRFRREKNVQVIGRSCQQNLNKDRSLTLSGVYLTVTLHGHTRLPRRRESRVATKHADFMTPLWSFPSVQTPNPFPCCLQLFPVACFLSPGTCQTYLT